jgi:hypothetical protein
MRPSHEESVYPTKDHQYSREAERWGIALVCMLIRYLHSKNFSDIYHFLNIPITAEFLTVRRFCFICQRSIMNNSEGLQSFQQSLSGLPQWASERILQQINQLTTTSQ